MSFDSRARRRKATRRVSCQVKRRRPESRHLRELFAQSVCGSSLAIFRVAVGVVMALEGYALLVPHAAAITYGTPLDHYYTGKDINFHFPYEGFEWLPMLPPTYMYGLVGLLMVAGITMALGFCYRTSAITVFAIWAYLFIVESTRTYWQSHYYLELLLTFLLMWMPAANRWSVDNLIRNRWRWQSTTFATDASIPLADEGLLSIGTVPFWTIFLLRGQLVIAYFYAGVAKLNADWLLDAAPLRWFLAEPSVLQPYAPYLSSSQFAACQRLVQSPALAYFLSYTGAAFDLAIGFLLIWRRSRILGLGLMLIFHATNHLLVFDDIGWFPIAGAATALIFLDPDWPERVWRWLKRPRCAIPNWGWATFGAIAFPIVGFSLGWKLKPTQPLDFGQSRLKRLVVPCVCGWLVWQAVLPLRHHFIDSDARFTYEGFSFSWRLKADSRQAIGHSLTLVDSRIIEQTPTGAIVHWDQWKGDRALYRRLQPSRIHWPQMPEFVVVLEPVIGERIIYNPFSGLSVSHDDTTARLRLSRFWRKQYGREPCLHVPLSRSDAARQIIDELGPHCKAQSALFKLKEILPGLDRLRTGTLSNEEATSLVRDFTKANVDLLAESETIIRPILRQTYPFLFQGEQYRPAPFFIIDDADLTCCDANGIIRVDRKQWKQSRQTSEPGQRLHQHTGVAPLVVYLGSLAANQKQTLLPQSYVRDAHLNRNVPPVICWNSMKDMSPSKYMHTSGQAFYLRRYARRIAEIWHAQYGRRPRVHAQTRLSYNRRRHQLLVDPHADLANVAVSWFRHNPWIYDLKEPRIPREALIPSMR